MYSKLSIGVLSFNIGCARSIIDSLACYKATHKYFLTHLLPGVVQTEDGA